MYKLTNIEVFAAGVWNDDKYTAADLDDMVTAFDKLKDRWTPVLKRGHQEKQEQPALGYITRLKRIGEKLVADITDIPALVYQAVKKGLFKRVSSEIFWNYKDTERNEEYPRVLKAVALLGASIPAVTSLKEIKVLFEQENMDKLKIYEVDGLNELHNINREGIKMDFEKMLSEKENEIKVLKDEIKKLEAEKGKDTQAKMTQYQNQLKEKELEIEGLRVYKKENDTLKKDKESLESENKIYKDQLEVLMKETNEKDIEGFVKEYGVKGAKKILPKHEQLIKNILINCPIERKFTVDGKKEKMSLADMVRQYISELPQMIDLEQRSRDTAGSDFELSIRTEVAKKAKEYMREHKTSYIVSLKAVLDADEDLKKRYYEKTIDKK